MNRNMEAITWSLHARGISPTARVLLTELCGHVNSSRDDYAVWPSHGLLADNVEISVSGVKRHLKELVDSGYLTVRAGQRTDGGRSSNVYDIAVESAHRMPQGRVVRTKAPPVQNDLDPLVQNELAPRATGERGAQVNGDLCNEPLKERTSERKNTPLSLTGETPPTDLLGDPIADPGKQIVEANPNGTIMEYVAKGWNALADDFTRIPRVRVWNDARKKLVARRAGEVVRASDGILTAYQVWDMVFQAIRNDPWLRGEAQPGRGHDRAFVIEIDHVLRAGGNPNFTRILERATTNDIDRRATSDPATGRPFGPAEQATRNALARLRARNGGGS